MSAAISVIISLQTLFRNSLNNRTKTDFFPSFNSPKNFYDYSPGFLHLGGASCVVSVGGVKQYQKYFVNGPQCERRGTEKAFHFNR